MMRRVTWRLGVCVLLAAAGMVRADEAARTDETAARAAGLGTSLEAPAGVEAPAVRVPLQVLESWRWMTMEREDGIASVREVATVVAAAELPKGVEWARAKREPSQWQTTPQAWYENHPVLDGFIAGTLKLSGPTAQKDVQVILIGPELSSGMAWAPEAVTMRALPQGMTITVQMGLWTDNGGRDKNVPGRNTYVVSLGKLPAGTYNLQIVERHMFKDAASQRRGYEWKGQKSGSCRFTVVAGGEGPQAEPAATAHLPAEAMAKADVPKGVEAREYVFPMRVETALGCMGVKAAYTGLKVGQFDSNAWIRKPPKNAGDLPEVKEAEGRRGLYAVVVGPVMNTGETMTLRDAWWVGNKLTMAVELWRDTGGRNQNTISNHVLIVPVNPPEGAESVVVSAEYTLLMAEMPGGTYTPTAENAPKAEEATVRIEEEDAKP